MKIFKKFSFWLPVIFLITTTISILLIKSDFLDILGLGYQSQFQSMLWLLLFVAVSNPFNWFSVYLLKSSYIINLLAGVGIWFLIGLLIDKLISKFKKNF